MKNPCWYPAFFVEKMLCKSGTIFKANKEYEKMAKAISILHWGAAATCNTAAFVFANRYGKKDYQG
jgi:hypothetical protein